MATPSRMRKRTSALVVRPSQASDDAFIYPLSNRVFGRYSRQPTRSMASMLGERGASSYVAEDEGLPVGFFVLGFEELGRSFGPWERPAVSRLNAIAVEPDLHRRGIGALLLETAMDRAREHRAVSMTLMTADTNTKARRLFERHGFHPVHVLEDAYAGRQRGIVMMKALIDLSSR